MPVVSASEARASLLSKGFVEREAPKHVFYDLYLDGKYTGINTHFSRGKKEHSDIDESLMDLMKHQLKLQRMREVFELLNCNMDGTKYRELLQSSGGLTPPKPL